MPKIQAGNITMNYDQQGGGEPLVLIPYLAADYACYAFQVADYSKQFTCVSVDLRGTGESDKPGGVYSTEMFADDVAALMQAIGIHKAHIYGLSLGAATGMWLSRKISGAGEITFAAQRLVHERCLSQDRRTGLAGDGQGAKQRAGDGDPRDLPWCFTPELYAQKPDYIQALSDFVRGRPKQPVDAFIQESNAVIAHDAEAQLGRSALRRRSPSGATTWLPQPASPTG